MPLCWFPSVLDILFIRTYSFWLVGGSLVGGCREGSGVGRLRQLFNSLCLNPGVDVVCLYHP